MAAAINVDHESDAASNYDTEKTKKKKEPGIIYLSYIPPYMTVKKLREILNVYGPTDKIFLQPDKSGKGKKRSKKFVEGWVEFKSKNVAKRVSAALNGQQVGGKRKCPWYDSLWSMKYLHRFKWTHLNERLAYEKAVQSQRMRTEIAQAKRESNFYSKSVDKGKSLERAAKKKEASESDVTKTDNSRVYHQKNTEEEMIREQQMKSNNVKTADVSFLKSIFGSKS